MAVVLAAHAQHLVEAALQLPALGHEGLLRELDGRLLRVGVGGPRQVVDLLRRHARDAAHLLQDPRLLGHEVDVAHGHGVLPVVEPVGEDPHGAGLQHTGRAAQGVLELREVGVAQAVVRLDVAREVAAVGEQALVERLEVDGQSDVREGRLGQRPSADARRGARELGVEAHHVVGRVGARGREVVAARAVPRRAGVAVPERLHRRGDGPEGHGHPHAVLAGPPLHTHVGAAQGVLGEDEPAQARPGAHERVPAGLEQVGQVPARVVLCLDAAGAPALVHVHWQARHGAGLGQLAREVGQGRLGADGGLVLGHGGRVLGSDGPVQAPARRTSQHGYDVPDSHGASGSRCSGPWSGPCARGLARQGDGRHRPGADVLLQVGVVGAHGHGRRHGGVDALGSLAVGGGRQTAPVGLGLGAHGVDAVCGQHRSPGEGAGVAAHGARQELRCRAHDGAGLGHLEQLYAAVVVEPVDGELQAGGVAHDEGPAPGAGERL